MHIPRLVISAARGGAGKTLLSLGLTRAFVRQGLHVKACKKGPDYIDAAWLSHASGGLCTNLDPFFLEPSRLRALVRHVWEPPCTTAQPNTAARPFDLMLIEGNRGLFDGRDVHGSCSSAELAKTLGTPVLLSVDITKMTRTTAALVAGLTRFDPGVYIGGVVLNQCASVRHETIVRQTIEAYTDVPVLGALPRFATNPLPERHMGLTDARDTDAEAVLERLARAISDHVDTRAVLRLAQDTAPLPEEPPFWPVDATPPPAVRIGYVRDAVLWFYYQENLEALERAGATLTPLSLLDETPWPDDLDGLYLGGGFPEEWGARLRDCPHFARIAEFSAAGMPVYAECGGFMLLSQGIVRGEAFHPMAGLFPVRAHFHPRPQGLGYVEATVTRANPFHPLNARLRGHEFHYSRCEGDTRDLCTLHLTPGTGMGDGRDGLLIRNTMAAYTHLYAPAMPHWAPRFVRCAADYARQRQSRLNLPEK